MALREIDFMKLVTIARLDDRLMTPVRTKELLKGLEDDARAIARVLIEIKAKRRVEPELLEQYRPQVKDILRTAGRAELTVHV